MNELEEELQIVRAELVACMQHQDIRGLMTLLESNRYLEHRIDLRPYKAILAVLPPGDRRKKDLIYLVRLVIRSHGTPRGPSDEAFAQARMLHAHLLARPRMTPKVRSSATCPACP